MFYLYIHEEAYASYPVMDISCMTSRSVGVDIIITKKELN